MKIKYPMVLAGWPGIGKTHVFKFQDEYKLRVSDSDSSHFSWIKNSDGSNTNKRHPEWPENYIEHIKNTYDSGLFDLILVSTHEEVLRKFVEYNIPYVKVLPDNNLKSFYLKLYKNRGNPQGFIDVLEQNWERWHETCRNIPSITSPFILKQGQHLADIIITVHYHYLRQITKYE